MASTQGNHYAWVVYRRSRSQDGCRMDVSEFDQLRKIASMADKGCQRRVSLPAHLQTNADPRPSSQRRLSVTTDDLQDLTEAFNGYRMREKKRRISMAQATERRKDLDSDGKVRAGDANRRMIIIALVILLTLLSVLLLKVTFSS